MNIKENVKNYIEKELFNNNQKITEDNMDIISSGFLDSLSTVRLLIFIEETYGISFDTEEDIEQLRSLAGIETLVLKKMNLR